MDIIVGKTAGFCFGVANAVNKTSKFLKENENTFCLGELVHNKQVINDLEEKGLKIVDNVEQAKQNVIIRAHGTTKQIYDKAIRMGLKVVDLTCPKVIRIHKIAEESARDGNYIFLIGNSSHPETIGTISYCGKNSCIIETEQDIKNAIQQLVKSKIKKVVILAQTTFSMEKFNKFVKIIQESIKDKDIELKTEMTICDATRLRQEETEKMSAIVDMMIIIGGKHSSNTSKLYEISEKNCKCSILIEEEKELNLQELKNYEKIGIMAGASTPNKTIKAVVEKLQKVC